ncbi:MAG: hypothetical protein L6V81_01235 [Clostridium sp.]|nr:MAG: hypothetical protein L6V81_01235 [Clostridium sp.]
MVIVLLHIKILKDNTDATVIIDAISKQFRYLYQIKVLMKSMPLPSIVTKKYQ